jgi:hypothetical protein
MGCDIHMVLEKKHDGHWLGLHDFPYIETEKGYSFPPATSRNYQRFAMLAGVRGEGPDPKGFPADASELSQMLYDRMGGDAHSPSYMMVEDAEKVFLETANESALNDWRKKYPSCYFFGVEKEDGFENFRIVFWFDN